jgi:hypothetical protein
VFSMQGSSRTHLPPAAPAGLAPRQPEQFAPVRHHRCGPTGGSTQDDVGVRVVRFGVWGSGFWVCCLASRVLGFEVRGFGVRGFEV